MNKRTRRRLTEARTLEVVLDEVRSTLRGRRQNSSEIAAIISLYGSIISLCARAKRIGAIVRMHRDVSSEVMTLDGMALSEAREFSGFFEELLEFGEHLNEVSFAVVDIFFPGLKEDLLSAVGGDVEFSRYYLRELAPKYGLTEGSLPLVLSNILDRFDGDRGPRNSGGQLMLEFGAGKAIKSDYRNRAEVDLFYKHRDIPVRIFIDNFFSVGAALERCRETISEIVREHWSFRDLSALSESVSVNIKGDVRMSETRYVVSHSQVGAIGPNAHVHDVQFRQMLEQASKSLDTVALAKELDQLKEELAKLASERDHFAALVAISDAAVDAKSGDGIGALSKLTAAGRWAFDVATKIGVAVAADAIKVAVGLK